MKKVSLLFGIHMHQPVDNFDETVAKAVTECYEPFFKTVMQTPNFKFSLHCSGWLLEKIQLEYPKLFEIMQYLSKKGAIEWLSGGYYEPVLCSIPSKDRVAQIQKLNLYIQKYMQQKPKGLWLTERVWDNTIIRDLKRCNIEYVMVDDYHFLSNGYPKEKMNGYYITNDGNSEIKLFPISKKLRYALPFSKPQESIDSILQYASTEPSAAIFFDDAEKFGLWPKTNEWVYGQKWLENFIENVLQNSAIKTMHYNEYINKNRALGLAYLNDCSYSEMGKWSLKTELAEEMEDLIKKVGEEFYENEGIALIKGGIWNNFFIKYSESNYLHKRMLYLSSKQKELSQEALDSLYRLQTNDTYWHGVFGGFYLPNLRDNAYKYLLKIEKSLQQKGEELIDINKDGFKELKVLTDNLSIVISKIGAQMVEFGSLEKFFNWQNTIMRRKELYHNKILHPQMQNVASAKVVTIHNLQRDVKSDFKELLIYDWYAKNSFIEHISDREFTLENFKNLTYKEIGDFVNEPFEYDGKSFTREGKIGNSNAILKKKYHFKKSKIVLKSKLESEYSKVPFFAQEFNFHFAHSNKITINGKFLNDGLLFTECKSVKIYDDFTQKELIISSDEKWQVFAVPIITISESEKDYEAITQGVSFLFTREFEKSLKIRFELEVKDV